MGPGYGAVAGTGVVTSMADLDNAKAAKFLDALRERVYRDRFFVSNEERVWLMAICRRQAALSERELWMVIELIYRYGRKIGWDEMLAVLEAEKQEVTT